jgi:predicted peptidase
MLAVFKGSIAILLVLTSSLMAQSHLFDKHIFLSQGDTLPYRLMKPMTQNPKAKYPLVLCLHGAGERGRDNELNLKHVTALFIDSANRIKYPAFVLVPQCPPQARWVDVDWRAESHRMPAKPSPSMRAVIELVEQISKQYPIDKTRIYVTGLSMGGYGTWDIICRKPDFFAAAVPVCGGGDEAQVPKIKHIPIWVFHGSQDGIVKVQRSRNMVQALKEQGSSVLYTEYPDVQHDSWKPAYQDPKLAEWLFSQKLKK